MKIYVAYVKRMLYSYLFWISIFGIGLITYLGLTEETPRTLVSSFNVMLDLSSYRKLMMLFAVLPFGMNYCREWNHKFTSFIMARISTTKHLLSYILMQFFSSFTVTFIGIILGMLILLFKVPIYIDEGTAYSEGIYSLLSHNKAVIFLILRTFIYSVSIATWSMAGLAMSALFLNSYIAVISPLVFSYGLELITIESSFLPNLWYLSLSYTDFSGDPIISTLYILSIFLMISSIFALIFFGIAKRRAQNEIH